MVTMKDTQRIFGLDLFRVLAIAVVVLAQLIWMFPQMHPLIGQAASVFYFLGLEIFFVLSGFLLYKKLYPIYLAADFGWPAVQLFLRKRLVRILPLYFLALLFNWILALVLEYPIADLWKYFLLIQNFSSPMSAFFSESWGLPIILFANILLPFALWVLQSIFKPKNKGRFFFWVTVVLTLIFMMTKIGYHFYHQQTDLSEWNLLLKGVLIYRVDAVFIGVLASWLLFHYEELLGRLSKLTTLIGIVGVGFLFVGVGFFQLLIESHPLFWNVFYLPMTAVILASFLPLFVSWHRLDFRTGSKLSAISDIVYPFYLFNTALTLQILRYYFAKHQSSTELVLLMTFCYFLIIALISKLSANFYQKKMKKMLSGTA